MFHVCTIGQKGEVSDIKFLCLNGTVFDQETRVCERIDEVDCEKSEDFFNLNLELYGNTANFGSPQECGDDECEEDEEAEDSEYEDDTESTTVLTTTTVRTTTPKPTTQRTTVRTTQQTPRTQGYTRYTTQQPDSISALLALHNAFNQGLNRRPILSPIPPTRLPSITSTTTRRTNLGYTLRTRFGTPDHQRHDHGYAFRPRPTYQPTFTSSVQTPFKSNYHTFESSDTHFVHSFDPEKPYNFQYFAQKSSPSPFTVRLEPEVQVVTSTSTSTSIKIANTTLDDFPYDDYDSFQQFFHDVPKITRPKRSTTRSSSARRIKPFSRLNIESNIGLKGPQTDLNPSKRTKKKEMKNDHHRNPLSEEYNSNKTSSPSYAERSTSVKEVQNFESKRTSPLPTPQGFSHKVSSTSPETTTENLFNNNNLMSSMKPEGFSHKIKPAQTDSAQSPSDQVIKIDPTAQSPSDHVIKIDPSDVLIAKNYTDEESSERKEEYLNNLLDTIAMESTEKSRVSNLLRKSEPEMEQLITSKGVDMMLETLENKLMEMELEGHGSGVAFEYEGDSLEIREKRGSDNKSLVGGNEENVSRDKDDELNCNNPDFCVEMTSNDDIVKVEIEGRQKRSTNRVRVRIRPEQSKKEDTSDEDNRFSTEASVKTTKKSRRKVTRTRIGTNKNVADSEQTKNWDSSRRANKEVATTTKQPDIKPVTEEIEGDVTTAEYRRPPPNNKWRRNYHSEVTTPYSAQSSTRLQTRFDYENRNLYVTTLQTTSKPNHYRHVPVYEQDEDYMDFVEIKKSSKKQHKVNKRAAIVVDDEFYMRPERRAAYSDENEEINVESISLERTRPRAHSADRRRPVSQNPVDNVSYNVKASDVRHSNPLGRGRASVRINESSSNNNFRNDRIASISRDIKSDTNVRQNQDEAAQSIPNPTRTRQRNRSRIPVGSNGEFARAPKQNEDSYRSVPNEQSARGQTRGRNSHRISQHQASVPSSRVNGEEQVSKNANVFVRNFDTTERTSDYHRGIKQENADLRQSRFGMSLREDERFKTQDNTNRRKVNNHNQYTDRSVLPEEITYATLRPEVFPTVLPDHHRKSNSNALKSSVNTHQDPTDSSDLEKSAAPTDPPAPYSPGPGIEADPNFSCRGLVKGGLYADVHADCHGFFICSQARRGIVGTHFWCGVGTRFNQKTRTCQAASLVDCSIAPRLYYLNDNTYIPSLDLEDKLRGSFEPMREH